MLMDMGRSDDAGHIKKMLAVAIYSNLNATNSYGQERVFVAAWKEFTTDLARIFWWDIFDWQSTLRVMGEKFGKTPVGRKGQITLPDDTIVNIQNWVLNSGGQIEVALRDPDESP